MEQFWADKDANIQKQKWYDGYKFPGDVIISALDVLLTKVGKSRSDEPSYVSFDIESENETWEYTSIEEFLTDYSKKTSGYSFSYEILKGKMVMQGIGTSVRIMVRLSNRADIQSVFQKFEENLERSKVEIKLKIFIGHGNNPQWRDLKDHLHEKHGYDIIAYEIGPKGGLTIKEVLESMLKKSSIGFLILTGDDVDNYGEVHARENVIHELGLFQGRLGFRRAIILKEDNVKEFSNIHGFNQIRFSKGNIKETFGEVLAVIKELSESRN